MRTNFLLLSAIILSSGYGQSQQVKRQGLFSCTGWGASCMSGWTSWRRHNQKNGKPKTVKLLPVEHKVVSRPRDSVTKFWLTTEKTWGPMGKRSTVKSVPILLKALLEQYISRQNDNQESIQPSYNENLPLISENNDVFTKPH